MNLDEKARALDRLLREWGQVAVAFSAGVDSTLLLHRAVQVLGPERVVAVTTRSPSVPEAEVAEARRLAAEFGVSHEVAESREMDRPEYVANTGDRCFHCRLEMYTLVEAVARSVMNSGRPVVVVDGANVDDEGDYRPGLQAGIMLGVRSPFREVGLTKKEIRALARSAGLPNWDKPSAACLSSRIPVGTPVSVERLRQIERAESALREAGFRQVRVRHHGEIARIEVLPDDLPRIVSPPLRSRVLAAVSEAGFRFVTIDLAGYRMGSLNPVQTGEGTRKGRHEPK